MCMQAVTALKKLNVPYLVSLPLVFQTTEEWLDSELGVHPVQVALQVPHSARTCRSLTRADQPCLKRVSAQDPHSIGADLSSGNRPRQVHRVHVLSTGSWCGNDGVGCA